MKACTNCRTSLPDEARFCFQCGAPQPQPSAAPSDLQIDWQQALAPQISAHFFDRLQQNVQSEYGSREPTAFSERVYASGFRDTVQRRAQQVGERLHDQLELDAISVRRANNEIERLLEELVDFFVVRHCRDLVSHPMPETILKYQGLKLEQIDLFQMLLDYLDFAHEAEPVYTDFLTMPVEKLKNAGRSFLFPEKNEKILLICDQSILGSCKEGFAFTAYGLYWRAHLQKPQQVGYGQLQRVEREQDWIKINGHFFNVNASMNLKVLKLLKRLRLLQPSSR